MGANNYFDLSHIHAKIVKSRRWGRGAIYGGAFQIPRAGGITPRGQTFQKF
jgi:hypothetical protein